MRVNFVIKKPRPGDRRVFAILKVVTQIDRTRKSSRITHPTLSEINKRLIAGSETVDSAMIQVERVRKQLYSEIFRETSGESISSENQKVLDIYWKREYEYRELEDLKSAEGDLLRAIRALGEVSLKTATQQGLQKKVNELENNRQRRAVDRINQLLRFLGRDFKLKKKKKLRPRVKYLEEKEFLKVLNKIKSPSERALMGIAFYSGLRIGECFALEKRQHVESNVLFIDQQLSKEMKPKPPKRNKERNTFIFPRGLAHLKQWLKVPMEERAAMRNIRWADRVHQHCSKAFPGQTDKFLRFHDLRHSYAIALISSGVHINDVALSLGDGIQTCQDHYIGFIRKTSHTQAIISKIKKR